MKTRFIILMSLMLGLTSCFDNILDKEPQDIYSDKNLWNSKDLIEAYVIDLYSTSRFGGIFRDNEKIELITTTDEALGGQVYAHTHEICRGVINSTNGFNQHWDYEFIRRANYFLENYKQGVLEPELLENRAAEVRFLRAFCYFEMVKRYGGVPLVLKVQDMNEGDKLFVSRNKEDEVYDFIIKECDDITKILPESYEDAESGRITRYAAWALLSRAALYAGSIAENGSPIKDPNGKVGIPADKAQAYYQASLDASNELVGKFSLYEKKADKALNYQNLFLDTEKNSEVILWKKYVPLLSGHNYDWWQSIELHNVCVAVSTEMVNSFDMIDGSNKEIDFSSVTGDLNTILEKKDPRLHATVLWNGAEWKNKPVQSYRGVIDVINGERVTMTDRTKEYKGMPQQGADFCENMATGFTLKKYLDPESSIKTKDSESGTDYIVFRYAEILLNKAEAAFKLGDPDTALDAINEIRRRAGVFELTSIDMQKIMDERKVELAFEEHRFYDIRRWRIAEEVIAKDLHSAFVYYDFTINDYRYTFYVAGNEAGKRKFLPQHYYLPIMPDRISNNPNLTENPGYN